MNIYTVDLVAVSHKYIHVHAESPKEAMQFATQIYATTDAILFEDADVTEVDVCIADDSLDESAFQSNETPQA